MDQHAQSTLFARLHQKNNPLVLYNIWDAASAKVVESSGAQALATGSWSVAGAQGYADGELLPLPFLLQIVQRIVASVSIPLSVDFEGGYAVSADEVADNVAQLIVAGAVGINFEDQIVGNSGLHSIGDQTKRIAAIRLNAAEDSELDFFINARTDVFLKERDSTKHASHVPEAIERGQAYAEAGASGFFVPGLNDLTLLAEVCNSVDLPVNAMASNAGPSLADLGSAGVARISHGPGPFRTACADLADRHREAMV